MMLSVQAYALLRAMRGALLGCLEGNESFVIDPGWTGPVPHEIARELHDAGFIEIDEEAPIRPPYAFRLSEAGRRYLAGSTASGLAAGHSAH